VSNPQVPDDASSILEPVETSRGYISPEVRTNPQLADAEGAITQGKAKSGIASLGSFNDRLLELANEETPAPDFSELIKNQKREGFYNALMQIGAGIASNDMGAGLSEASKQTQLDRKGIRELEAAQEAGEYEASLANRRLQTTALAAGAQAKQVGDALTREILRQDETNGRAALAMAYKSTEDQMAGVMIADPEKREAIRQAYLLNNLKVSATMLGINVDEENLKRLIMTAPRAAQPEGSGSGWSIGR
jgi:hypothetical protein